MRYRLLMVLAIAVVLVAVSQAQDEVGWDPAGEEVMADTAQVDTALIPEPVSNLRASDKDNDHGHAITLTWDLSPDDGSGPNPVIRYDIYRWKPALMDTIDSLRQRYSVVAGERKEAEGEARDSLKTLRDEIRSKISSMISRLDEAHAQYPEGGAWDSVNTAASGESGFVDSGSKDELSQDFLPDGVDFYYQVYAVSGKPEIAAASEIVGPVQSSGQWINTGRYPVLFAVLIFGILTVVFVQRAKGGAELYVRPLAGIEAVDDAIGRATEMGRPILYVLGLGTASDVATIASFTILSRVAKRVAEYQTSIIVPTYDPIVMSVAQEVVKSAYLDAGRPDDYDENSVFFVTNLQFAYVAAVNGIMLRELPATNVYMGKFYAESLILAETGALAGSIQIAGTDEIAQIPFFIVACDYTLIGEELYAASAYLGREPVLLGSLKAQDWAKAMVIILAVVGLGAALLDIQWLYEAFKIGN